MSLNFVILCIVVITQALGKPLNTYEQLKNIANKKCPLLENSVIFKPKPEFLKQCDSVNTDMSQMVSVSKNNQDAVLCSIYISTFGSLCNSVSQTNEDVDNLPAIENLKTNDISNVCSILATVTETNLLKPFIIKALRSPQTCSRLCSDFDNTPTTICSLSSFMFGSSSIIDSLNKSQTQKKPKVLVPQEKVESSALEKNAEAKDISSTTAPNGLLVENTNLPKVNKTLVTGAKVNPALLTNGEESTANTFVEKIEPGKKLPEQQVSSSNDQTEIKPSSNIKTVNNDVQHSTTEKLSKIPNSQIKLAKSEPEPVAEVPSIKPIEKQPTDLDTTSKAKQDKQKLVDNQDNKHTVIEKKDSSIKNPVDYTSFNGDEDGDNDFENINDVPPKQVKEKANTGDNSFTDQNIYEIEQVPKSSEVKLKPAEVSKPREIDEDSSNLAANFQNQNIDDSDSYFFSYFMMVCVMFICGYVAYHNKQKILALVLEGRKGRRPSRSRRPNSANYHKLDTTLEEAVTSSCNKNTTQVIY